MERVRQVLRARHYSPRTEKAYAGWIRHFIVFHGRRHPNELTALEVEAFLTDLAVRKKVTASTQNQAFSALLFLYREVLDRQLEGLEAVVRAKRPVRLPIVLSEGEVDKVLAELEGVPLLMASLMYGAGLRLLECSRLRTKDLDFERREITVRDGKGRKDRTTLLPETMVDSLERHMERNRSRFLSEVRRGVAPDVPLPNALTRKFPAAAGEWAWQ